MRVLFFYFCLNVKIKMLNSDIQNPDILKYNNVNEAMRKYYIDLTRLQLKIKEESDLKAKELIQIYYDERVHYVSMCFERILSNWDGKHVDDIIDYMFERCNVCYAYVDDDDDDYYMLEDGDIRDTCNPDKRLLKRIYDAVMVRYPTITNVIPEHQVSLTDRGMKNEKCDGGIYKNLDSTKRQRIYKYWRDVVYYLHAEEYVLHFLESNILYECDAIKLLHLIDHEIDIVPSDGSKVMMFHYLYYFTKFKYITELYNIKLNIRETVKHYYKSIHNVEDSVKQSHKDFYENGIYWIMNNNLDQIQKDLNKFKEDFDVLINELNVNSLEYYNIHKYDHRVSIFIDFVLNMYNNISNDFCAISRNINRVCFNVEYEWVKSKLMDEYNQSLHSQAWHKIDYIFQ